MIYDAVERQASLLEQRISFGCEATSGGQQGQQRGCRARVITPVTCTVTAARRHVTASLFVLLNSVTRRGHNAFVAGLFGCFVDVQSWTGCCVTSGLYTCQDCCGGKTSTKTSHCSAALWPIYRR